jgi:hypothetical protein
MAGTAAHFVDIFRRFAELVALNLEQRLGWGLAHATRSGATMPTRGEDRMSRDRRTPITNARLWVRSNIITTVLIIFIVLSLMIHAVTLGALWRVRSVIQRQLDLSTEQLAQVRTQKVPYTFPIDQTFTIDTTVTISDTVLVPIVLSVPIKQTVTLPLDTGFGEIPITVPLDITVPISDTIAVPINKQLPFRADIPIRTDIPIEIDLSSAPLGDILQQFIDAIQDLRNHL